MDGYAQKGIILRVADLRIDDDEMKTRSNLISLRCPLSSILAPGVLGENAQSSKVSHSNVGGTTCQFP